MVSFQINVEDLPPSEALLYLGQTITYKKSDWPEVYQNLKKARRWWGMIARVLAKTGATVRVYGMMYKAVDQLVILYGIKIWVVTGDMLKVMEGFRHRESMRITGMTESRGAGREWEYPPVVASLEAARLHPIMDYIRMQQTTIE